MSNNIFNSNDDDIFEDIVDQSTQNNIEESVSDKTDFEKVFSEIDSPFKNLITNSSIKVNFSEAFYGAAHEWVIRGYQQANANAMIQELATLTNGQFLYRHRLMCVKEAIERKKTILKFLNMILEDTESSGGLVMDPETTEHIKFSFNETYFSMFFRSFYNILMHTFHREVALYKALCDIVGEEHDPSLCDPSVEPSKPIEGAEFINSLYIQYFDGDIMQEKIDKYAKEIFDSQNQA